MNMLKLDKTITQAIRSGLTVGRVGKMAENSVCLEAIAAQMTHRSATGVKYTVEDVDTIVKIYNDCKSSVLVTKKQAQALINDAAIDGASGLAPA